MKLKLATRFIIHNRQKTTVEILEQLEKITSDKEYINLIFNSFRKESKLETFLLIFSLLENQFISFKTIQIVIENFAIEEINKKIKILKEHGLIDEIRVNKIF